MSRILIFLLLSLICGVAGCTTNTPDETPVLRMPPLNGGSLNNLGWTFDGGRRTVFSEAKGKVLVLDFYATWCDPCRRSVPHLIGLQQKYESQGLQVVGLNVGGAEDEAEVPAFAREFGIQYTLAKPDDDLVTFLLAGTYTIPQTFVFDRQGQLAERIVGFGSEQAETLDKAVETALKTPSQ